MMDSSWLFLFFIVILFAITYYYLISPYDYWKKQGIESVLNVVPGFGNILPMLCFRKNLPAICDQAYNECSLGSSMIGMYYFRTPALIVRDPELVKLVLVKEFQSFRNNLTTLDETRDLLLSKNPFFAKDDTWKDARTKLVTILSPKNVKTLFWFVHKVSLKFTDFLNQQVKEASGADVELKQLCTRFTSEVVSNVALGIDGDSFEENPNPGSFFALTEKMLAPTLENAFRQMLNFFTPALAATLNLSFMPQRMTDFFVTSVGEVLRQRRENKVVPSDMLQMMIDGASADKVNGETLAARVNAFFFDAYETVSSIASLACYKLSLSDKVQEKAREEISRVMDKHGGEIAYESLKDMTYLEQIVKETIRFYPILGANVKVCNENITLNGSDGQSCRLRPGDFVLVPTQSLHMDKKYWKNPRVFDPDRFDEERKGEIVKYTYLPFGEGPRVCPGMRFGMMEVKVILATILEKYLIRRSPRTANETKLDQRNFLTAADGGLWVKFEKILKD